MGSPDAYRRASAGVRHCESALAAVDAALSCVPFVLGTPMKCFLSALALAAISSISLAQSLPLPQQHAPGRQVASPNRTPSAQLVNPSRPSLASPSTPGIALVDSAGRTIGRPFPSSMYQAVLTSINGQNTTIVGLEYELTCSATQGWPYCTSNAQPGAAVWAPTHHPVSYESADCSGQPLIGYLHVPGVPAVGIPVVDTDGLYIYVASNRPVIRAIGSIRYSTDRSTTGPGQPVCETFDGRIRQSTVQSVTAVYRATEFGTPPFMWK